MYKMAAEIKLIYVLVLHACRLANYFLDILSLKSTVPNLTNYIKKAQEGKWKV